MIGEGRTIGYDLPAIYLCIGSYRRTVHRVLQQRAARDAPKRLGPLQQRRSAAADAHYARCDARLARDHACSAQLASRSVARMRRIIIADGTRASVPSAARGAQQHM